MNIRVMLALAIFAGLSSGCSTMESQSAPGPAPAASQNRTDVGQDAPLTGGVLFNGN